ncbi:MAG: ferrous iron transport protein B, partial [Myxococcota bacterium]|nr:ferrous iron transport protein B [Myxococcota bacterium]
LWAILSLGDDELLGVPDALRDCVARVRAAAEAEGRSLDREIIGARYARIDEIAAVAIRRAPEARGPSATDRIDAVLTHPIAGLVAFVLVMGILFQALFTWSEPVMTGIELAIAWAQGAVRDVLPDGPLRDLLVEGVIAGVGNVIVFVPQIALLSLFIAALEDWGYLARVAFVIDRMMNGVGLHGRAFVPLLSGFACAVPAVMATRTIENRKDRLVTMLALPLMSCSARLPIYTLMIAVAFPVTGASLPGGISVGAVALLAMYGLSVVATLTAASVLRRTVLPGPSPALVLELPPYRTPVLRNLLLTTWQRTRSFMVDAGTIILAITIVLWGLLSYPRHDDVESRFEAQRTEARAELAGEPLEDRLAEIDADNAAARMEHSLAGSFGRAIEPAIEPLGFDWKIGVGLVASFAAREVLVSTLGIVYGVGEADEVDEGLRAELRAARTPSGARVFTPLVGVSLMVFFVLAAQCMSTLAIVRRESGSWKWPILMVVYMNTMAYLASLAVFQIGRALGFS